MTEAEWLECTDVELMLRHVWDSLSERKARLIACAFCRRLWHLFDGEWTTGRTVIEIVERFVDGLTTDRELEVADLAFRIAHNRSHHRFGVRDPLEPIRYLIPFPDQGLYLISYAAKAARRVVPKKERAVEFSAQADLFRDVLGNPFHPVLMNPAWLSWNDGAVGRRAEVIYDERRFSEVQNLADALEEAGCTDAAILSHLRGPGPHVRGCWALDLILGRE